MMDNDSRVLRVASAQIQVSTGISENLEAIVRKAKQAARIGAEIVLFPETALTGYSPAIGQSREAAEWPAIRAGLQHIAQFAAELGIWIVVGSDAWDGQAWRNRLLAYSSEGQAAAIYDKVHLTPDDILYYAPGKGYPLFEIKGIKIGLQICYDVRFPEGYRSLLSQGVEVVMQGFYAGGSNTWKTPVMAAHLRSRAAENGIFLVAANYAGPLQFVISQVVDPQGLLLAQANQDCEELIWADLELGSIANSFVRQDCLTRFRDEVFSEG